MIRNEDAFARQLPAGYDGEFMWDFLKGAFGPTIEPMDFDAVVERRGSFLLFETKAVGVQIPQGQKLTIEAALRDKRWTAILCAKRPEEIREWIVWTRTGRTHFDGDAAALKAWCQIWYEDKNARDPIW